MNTNRARDTRRPMLKDATYDLHPLSSPLHPRMREQLPAVMNCSSLRGPIQMLLFMLQELIL
jgi:hypothetical protein